MLGRYALRRVARIAPAYSLALAGAAVLLAGVAPSREPTLAQLPIRRPGARRAEPAQAEA